MNADSIGGFEDGSLNMKSLLDQAQKMSEQLVTAREEVECRIYEGQSGGNAVKIEVTGAFDFKSVSISPAAVDPGDVPMLEDLVLAALNHAVHQIGEQRAVVGDLAGFDVGSILDGRNFRNLLDPGDQ